MIDGRKPAAGVDWRLYSGLGVAGERWGLRLQDHARQTGDALLAARLEPEAPGGWSEMETGSDQTRLQDLRKLLEGKLPVQPESAGGTRRMLLDSMAEWQLNAILPACEDADPSAGPGCLMVVADLLPAVPGEEAVVLLVPADGRVQGFGLWIGADGPVNQSDLRQADGTAPDAASLREQLLQWRNAPPPLAPARVNQPGSGDSAIVFVP